MIRYLQFSLNQHVVLFVNFPLLQLKMLIVRNGFYRFALNLKEKKYCFRQIVSLKYNMDQSILRLQVLKRYKIDFVETELKFPAVSPEAGLGKEFISVLTRAFEDDVHFRYSEFNVFPTEVLIDYVKRTHQLYLSKTLHEIEQSIGLLNEAYIEGHELIDIVNNFYLDYKHDLMSHITKEDKFLIPYIEFLESSFKTGIDANTFYKKSSSFSIEDFFEDHEENDSELEKIRTRILKYDPPVVNRFIYGVLLNQFELFEHDLRVHGMIEEQVLIPRALVLERKLNVQFEKILQLN